jgi:Zn-dependent protease
MSDPQPPSGSIRLARVAGVPVYLDRTWLILGAFIAWTGWRSGGDLGFTSGTALAYAAWLVVSILVAVLGHEVAHAVAGRALGFRVHRIVATLWGGHTAYDGTGATPGRAAVIAVSGPVANAVLAAMGALAVAVLPQPWTEFAYWFFIINLLLAGFNLLPGLPLDGGQIVQSLIWMLSGRRDLGLVVAGWCGRVLAAAVVFSFGLLPVVRSGGEVDIISVVLALVMGWILWTGATAALRRAPFERLLDQLDPDEVIEPAGLVEATTPVGQLVGVDRRIIALDERGLPTLLLPLPSSDTPDVAALDPVTPLSSLVIRLPDSSVVDLPPGAGAEPLLRAMAASNAGVVVVISNGQLRGLVSAERLNTVAERHLRRN